VTGAYCRCPAWKDVAQGDGFPAIGTRAHSGPNMAVGGGIMDAS
jgi:hypothetical protein